MATVIVGTGIIGTATAYYLSQQPSNTTPSDIHLIESSPRLFASASGYAAGFCARNWYSDSVAPLGDLGFELHQQLAKENDGAKQWGYSRSTGTSWAQDSRSVKRGDDWLRGGTSRAEMASLHEHVRGKGPAWLRQARGGKLEVISEDSTTAQVDPLRLSQFLLKSCISRGVKLHQSAKPVAIQTSPAGKLESINIVPSSPDETWLETTAIPCTRLVITAGAWTDRVFSTLFPKSSTRIPISSLAGHSLLLRSPRWKVGDELLSPSIAPNTAKAYMRGLHNDCGNVEAHESGAGCHAVFTTDEAGYSPEIFSRAGGEIYIAGLNDAALPLPDLATDREIDAKSVEVLRKTARRLLSASPDVMADGEDEGEDDLEVLREGLCFRPVTEKGTPIITKVCDSKLGGASTEGGGVWIAAGHGPWGISLSLGTGKVMSEMIEGRETSCDVSRLGL